MLYAVVFWLKGFHAIDGIYDIISTRAIMMEPKLSFSWHCLLELGEYVHTKEDGENSMEAHALESLALQPTGNSQVRN